MKFCVTWKDVSSKDKKVENAGESKVLKVCLLFFGLIRQQVIINMWLLVLALVNFWLCVITSYTCNFPLKTFPQLKARESEELHRLLQRKYLEVDMLSPPPPSSPLAPLCCVWFSLCPTPVSGWRNVMVRWLQCVQTCDTLRMIIVRPCF